jgi:prepilin peptidase CpaA
MSLIQYAAFFIFPLGMAYAAASDTVSMTISNRVSLALFAAFVIFMPFLDLSWSAIGMHFAAGGTVLVVAFTMFAFGWIGGGDAKIAAVAALWLGWDQMLLFLGISAAFGGLLTLALLNFRGQVLPAAAIRQDWIARLHHHESGVPYGIALAFAALILYPASPWLSFAVG